MNKNYHYVVKERLKELKDIDNPFPYRCCVCGMKLIATWCESDIDNNIAYIDKNGKLWDVCCVCSAKLGLIAKFDLE